MPYQAIYPQREPAPTRTGDTQGLQPLHLCFGSSYPYSEKEKKGGNSYDAEHSGTATGTVDAQGSVEASAVTPVGLADLHPPAIGARPDWTHVIGASMMLSLYNWVRRVRPLVLGQHHHPR